MQKEKILSIKNFRSLIKFLSNQLNWPIDVEEFEDFESLTYEFNPKELGIKEEYLSKIKKIKQLRPVEENPFAIFWIEFESKNLPILALRRILNKFVEKKRELTDTVKWPLNEILFVTSHTNKNNKAITFAQFRKTKNKETLREFWWDEREINFGYIGEKLTFLKWPEDNKSKKEWVKNWSQAFDGSIRETIKDSKQLAAYLAEHAKEIKFRINEIFDIENKDGPLHQLYFTFKKVLIKDLSINDFQDMYAQTVTYGLFTAKCMNLDDNLNMTNLIKNIPETNPFLKKLLVKCFDISKYDSRISLDEIGIAQLSERINSLENKNTNQLSNIIQHFGRKSGEGKEDPIIHFYEGFLNAYEKEERKRRGEWYTPDQVVKFIVSSVDESLKNNFKLPLGLADTTSWEKMVESKRATPPREISSNEWSLLKKQPFVQILDPAAGTGTFLKHVILQIRQNLLDKWSTKTKEEIDILWNSYVRDNLLSRIYGFQITMAPYAVCHMQIGLLLKKTNYFFDKNVRLNVFLTNTLEPSEKYTGLTLFSEFIAKESEKANQIKNKYITVVLGNPPYKGISSNSNDWIDGLLKGKITDKQTYSNYYDLNGKSLDEKKIWLKDDYVKFIRYSHWCIERSSNGIFSLITNHSFIDSPTHRGMREKLVNDFNLISILNLNGNKRSNKRNKINDENVFDIMQGVSVGQFIKMINKNKKEVVYTNLIGSRQKKYDILQKFTFNTLDKFKIYPSKNEFYLLTPFSLKLNEEYQKGFNVIELFNIKSNGIQTSRDIVVYDFTKKKLIEKIKIIRSNKKNFSNKFIRDFFWKNKKVKNYKPGDTREWNLSSARINLKNDREFENKIKKISYRPFDNRFLFYADYMIDWPRKEVMESFEKENVALCVGRAGQVVGSDLWNLFYISKFPTDVNLFRRGGNMCCPILIKNNYDKRQKSLFLETEENRINFNTKIIKIFESKLNIKFNNKIKLNSNNNYYNIFSYICAFFLSKIYRNRYREYLEKDYPKIFVTNNKSLFTEMSNFGKQAISIFTGSNLKNYNKIKIFYKIERGEMLTQGFPKYIDNKIYINEKSFFGNIDEVIWNFQLGGYHVIKKWLTERKQNKFDKEVLNDFEQMCLSISDIDYISDKIDYLITKHKGFPHAFN